MVFPTIALADDATPPPAETSEVLPPTQEPVATEEPAVIEASPVPQVTEAAPVVEDSPIAPATEEPVIVESSPTALPELETPAVQDESSTKETEEVNLSEVVQAAAENNVTLADPTGEPLNLVTVQAAQTLTTGDPYFTRAGVTYRFLPIGGCAAYGGVSATCTESATPIQAALDNVHVNGLPDDSTVYVGPGTYAESWEIRAMRR